MKPKIFSLLTAAASASWGGAPRLIRRAWLGRRLGDFLLLAVLVTLGLLFAAQNGFIGHSDVQPYPY